MLGASGPVVAGLGARSVPFGVKAFEVIAKFNATANAECKSPTVTTNYLASQQAGWKLLDDGAGIGGVGASRGWLWLRSEVDVVIERRPRTPDSAQDLEN